MSIPQSGVEMTTIVQFFYIYLGVLRCNYEVALNVDATELRGGIFSFPFIKDGLMFTMLQEIS